MRNDYVTKKELNEALEKHSTKIVEDLTEVITAGFGLAATKKDLQALESKAAMKTDLKNLATKEDIAALEQELVDDTGAITGAEQKHHRSLTQRVSRLETHVFPKHS